MAIMCDPFCDDMVINCDKLMKIYIPVQPEPHAFEAEIVTWMLKESDLTPKLHRCLASWLETLIAKRCRQQLALSFRLCTNELLFSCFFQGTQIELSIGVVLGISTMAGQRIS